VTSILDHIRFRPTTQTVTGVDVVQLLPGERHLLLAVVEAARKVLPESRPLDREGGDDWNTEEALRAALLALEAVDADDA
jgi:hypothetical protein